MFRKTIIAAALACTTFAPAAQAERQIGLSINPRTAEEAQLLRFGLAAYALRKDYDANGQITQRGVNNAAGIYQGSCDYALIEQQGRGHTGTITQTGCNNVGALFQSGRGTNGYLRQGGGRTGVLFLYGF